MKEQPQALRLAAAVADMQRWPASDVTCLEVSAELRRLHDENKTLRARLAQPEPEPVAWNNVKTGEFCVIPKGKRPTADEWQPLYTTPPQRQPESEPTAWLNYFDNWSAPDNKTLDWHRDNNASRSIPLYTAQPQRKEEPEPWGYIAHKNWKMPVFIEADDLQAANLPYGNPDYTPVFKAPPRKEWQGLTDEEILQTAFGEHDIDFARAIEAKLREKNL